MKSEFCNLIKSLQTLTEDSSRHQIMYMLEPHIKKLVTNTKWLDDAFFNVDEISGFNGFKIHEQPDHRLSVFITSWLPNRGSPVHDHGTWSITASIIGVEHHVFWGTTNNNTDEEQLHLTKINEVTCNVGDIFFLEPHTIHSVVNTGKNIAISLQIYGKHPHFTERYQFNVADSRTKCNTR